MKLWGISANLSFSQNEIHLISARIKHRIKLLECSNFGIEWEIILHDIIVSEKFYTHKPDYPNKTGLSSIGLKSFMIGLDNRFCDISSANGVQGWHLQIAEHLAWRLSLNPETQLCPTDTVSESLH